VTLIAVPHISFRAATMGIVLAVALSVLAPVVPGAQPDAIKTHTTETLHAVDAAGHVFALEAGTTHVAVRWTGHPTATVDVAFSADGETFGDPVHVEVDEVGAAREDGVTYGTVMSVTGTRSVRVTADRRIGQVAVLAMNAAGEIQPPALGLGARAAAVNAIPGVIPRAGWGADETIRFDQWGEERWWSQYFPLQKLIVHHTAGSNGDPNPAATVRAIYHYHAVTQNWGDIGYNYLIDSAGRIYEGRHSREYWNGASPTSDNEDGLVISGGHALYHNAGTMGIAFLGTFTSTLPTTAAQSALISLLTWATSTHGISPTGATTYLNPVNGYSRTTHNIAGHRDYNQTGCPGLALYNLLPSIRTAVANATNHWAGAAFNPPRSLSLAAGTHIGYRFNATGGVIGSKPFTLGAPSSAPVNMRATVPNQAGDWYYVTAGVWAGYWMAASGAVVLGPPPPEVAVDSYRPWRPLTLAAGTYTGYRFGSFGNVTASLTATLGAPAMVPVTERSTIPNQPGTWYHVSAGTWGSYWIREQSTMALGTLPMAAFHSSFTSGIGPLTVAFTNDSITYGAASWAWDFDSDGTVDSTLRSPTYTYTQPGTYSVTMKVTDGLGTDTETKTGLITVRPAQVGTYVPIDPSRVLDSRFGTGLSGPFSPGVPRTFQVAGVGGIPANAVAVTGTLTVTGQNGSGYVFLGPDATPTPASSTLNFPYGDTRATGVTTALGPGGILSATLGGASAHVVFDVTGYFAPDASGATYVSLEPARIVDTRAGSGLSGPFAAQVPRTFQVAGLGGVPAAAVAVTGILTVTGQSGAGFYALGPDPVAVPSSSTLNFPMGDSRASGVTVALGPGGTLSATLSAASQAHLVFDVTGYFVPGGSGSSYVGLSPARLLDTRVAIGLSGPFAASVPRTFQVAGLGGVPTPANAVTGTLTAIGQSGAGYVYLGPTPVASPSSSTLNFPWGDVRANGVTVALGNGGTLSGTFLPAGTVHLLWDVSGYFVDASP
jgi:PKD repeat protein